MPKNTPAAEELFYNYLLEHPEAKAVIKSPLMTAVLDQLEEQACTIEELHSQFIRIDVPDLIEVLDALMGIHFVREDRMAQGDAYFLTDRGREFMKKYREAKKVFDVLGK